MTPAWVTGQTQTTYDRFQKLSWTIGPYLRFDDRQGYVGNLYLCMATGGSSRSEYLLDVENDSREPAHFTSAASMTGESLPSQQVGESVSPPRTPGNHDDVLYRQKVRVTLTKDLLLSCQSSGLTVRLYGQQRNLDVTIPAGYIQGFLQKS